MQTAAALVRTSSRVAINPTVELATAGEGEAAAATGGAVECCVIAGLCLLKSSGIVC